MDSGRKVIRSIQVPTGVSEWRGHRGDHVCEDRSFQLRLCFQNWRKS